MVCTIKIYPFLSLQIVHVLVRVIKTRRIKWAADVAHLRANLCVRFWWTNINEKDRLEYLRL